MANQYAPPQATVADVAQAGSAITVRMVDAMRGTKPWVLLIGILLFLVAVFSAIGGLAAMTGMAMMAGAGAGSGAPAGMVVGIGGGYLIGSPIYIFFCVFLVEYSSGLCRFIS